MTSAASIETETESLKAAAAAVIAEAVAWFKERADKVTLAELKAFVATVKREHVPNVLRAWGEHGLSGKLFIQIIADYARTLKKTA